MADADGSSDAEASGRQTEQDLISWQRQMVTEADNQLAGNQAENK
jgi:hypothetical protein